MLCKAITVAAITGLIALPAIADSGRMVKSIGSGKPVAPYCVWFQTANATNGIDPAKYGFSKRDTPYDQYTITINNALGSVLAPKFIIGDPQTPEHFHPEDCPPEAGFTYVSEIVRGP